jgi:co-chaperonin GroES (HSP10)
VKPNAIECNHDEFDLIKGEMLIKVDEHDKKSEGGILLHSQTANPKDRGTIVAVDYHNTNLAGEEVDNKDFVVGDRVVFNYNIQDYVNFDDGLFARITKEQIYCKLENETDRD